MDICQHKDMFGKPGQGAHSYRILNIAVVDVVATILVAVLFSYVFQTPLLYTTIGMFILGILMHRVFCVRTTVDKVLFPDIRV